MSKIPMSKIPMSKKRSMSVFENVLEHPLKRNKNEHEESELPQTKRKIGIILTLDNVVKKTFLGFANCFEPEKDYPQIGDKSSRICAFAIIPSQNKVILFANNLNPNFDLIDFEYKINRALEIMVRFNIKLVTDGVILISMDAPDKTDFQNIFISSFHNDAFPTITSVNANTQTQLRQRVLPTIDLIPTYSEYSAIEYRNDCVSTVVKNPNNDKSILRFRACPGTIMCIENRSQQHSSPYVIYPKNSVDGDPSRETGNSMLMDRPSQKTGNVVRHLYRTQFVLTSISVIDAVLKNLKIENDYIEINFDVTDKIRQLKYKYGHFEQQTIEEYLKSPSRSDLEIGGKIKRKTRSRKRSHVKKNMRRSKKSPV